MCLQCVFLSQFCLFYGFILFFNYYYGSEWSLTEQLMMMWIANSNNINRLIAMRNSYERTVWSFSRIQGTVESEYTHFNVRKWLESYPKENLFSTLHFLTVYVVKLLKCENLYLFKLSLQWF